MIPGILFIGFMTVVIVQANEDSGHCYTSSDIAGSVLGTFFATLAAIAAGVAVYWYICRRRKGKPHPTRPADVEAHAYDNPYFQEDEPEKAISTDIKAENGTTNSDNGKLQLDKNKAVNEAKTGKKNKLNNPFTNVFSNSKAHTLQRALDDSCIQQEPEKIEVRLRGSDFTGLGFNICGNIRHGIYVRDVLHRGPASESGKIKAGDRILSVTVSFDKITIEDALTILSYASPYDVSLLMQKTSEQPGVFLPDHQKKGSIISNNSSTGMGVTGEHLFHPVYRSQSSDDVSQTTREGANSKRSLSVGVVPPARLKKDAIGQLSSSQKVDPISESDSPFEEVHVQIHNELAPVVQKDIVAIVVNEVAEKQKSEIHQVSSNTNPFADSEGLCSSAGCKSKSALDQKPIEAINPGNRKNSTQTSSAYIVPQEITVEIPTFGLSKLPDEEESEVLKSTTSDVNGAVLGPCVEPSNHSATEEQPVIVHTVDGDGSDVPDFPRVAIPELTTYGLEDSLNEFDVKIPAMDLDDIQLSLEASLQQGLATETKAAVPASDIADMRSKETGETVIVPIKTDVSAIKQTIVASLHDPVKIQDIFKRQEPEPTIEAVKNSVPVEVEGTVKSKVADNQTQRIDGESKTVILPRVEIKTPSAADFEAGPDPAVKLVHSGKDRAPPPPVTPTSIEETLNENISYFETKIQSALQKSPKVKPKRNSIPGKRRAPPPPLVQPSSPIEDSEHSKPGNPFVVGIPSMNSQEVSVSPGNLNSTSVVFLKPNNVTTVQVNSGPPKSPTSPKSPKSPSKTKGDASFGLGFRKTNFFEGLDKAGGDDLKSDGDRFHSIPRSGLSIQDKKGMTADKGSLARRAASLDDLTKIEETKPLPLERAVSMDLNNAEEPSAGQLGDMDVEDGFLDRDSSGESFSKRVKVTGNDIGAKSYKKSWENLRDDRLNSPQQSQDLEQWIEENIVDNTLTKKFNSVEGFFNEKGIQRKNNDLISNTEGNANGDRVFVAVPLDRTLSVSTSSLSEDSIENEQITHRPPPKRQMIPVDPSTKTYNSDSESEGDQGTSRTFWVSASTNNSSVLSIKHDAPARRSPTVTIPVIPPIINARDLRTPSPHKDSSSVGLESNHSNKLPKLLSFNDDSLGENGEHDEHNGTATGSSYRYSVNNKSDGNEVSVNTMHVTVQAGKDGVEPYSVSSQGVVSKTVFIGDTQMAADSRLRDPESPPPTLQPPE